jgi:hypothetical protein
MTGTRNEIELRVLEFIYNLKYYSTRWLRAKFYAEMAGFLHLAHSDAKFKQVNSPTNALNDSIPQHMHKPSQTLLEAAAGVNDQ